jgi:hypothetical protein
VISSVAADRAGYPVAAGTLDGTFDPTLFHTVLVPLLGDLFLTRYAPDGCDPFAVTFPVAPTGAWTQSFQVAISARGAIAVTASYQGLIDFGGGPVGSSELGPSAALAMLDGEGHHQWSSAWRADGLVSLARPAFDAQGNAFVAGLFSGQLTLHGASIGASAPGLIDGFVAKVDPSGAVAWSTVLRLNNIPLFGSNISVAAWPEGDVAVSGWVDPSNGLDIDLGSGPMSTSLTGFVTSFDASAHHRWEALIEPQVTDSAIDGSGNLVLIGQWDGGGAPLAGFDRAGAMIGGFEIPIQSDAPMIAADPGGDVLVVGSLGVGVFAARANLTTGVRWIRSFISPNAPGGPGSDYNAAPAFGPPGAPIVGASFPGTLDLGTGPLTAPPPSPQLITMDQAVVRIPP